MTLALSGIRVLDLTRYIANNIFVPIFLLSFYSFKDLISFGSTLVLNSFDLVFRFVHCQPQSNTCSDIWKSILPLK